MTEISQIWKCNVCGNIVEVVHKGADSLVCCGQPMELQKENTVDASKEKHVPVIEATEDGMTLVKIGSEPHPMTEEHFIEWIEIDMPGETKACRKYLNPGGKPEGKFRAKVPEISARAYCNLHGLWASEDKV